MNGSLAKCPDEQDEELSRKKAKLSMPQRDIPSLKALTAAYIAQKQPGERPNIWRSGGLTAVGEHRYNTSTIILPRDLARYVLCMEVCLKSYQPVQTAAEVNNVDAIKLVLARCKSREAYDHSLGDSHDKEFWHDAFKKGSTEAFVYLFERDGKACKDGFLKDVYLHNASFQGYTGIVRWLLDHGADLHFDDDKALRNAVEFDRLPVIALLLERDANVFAENCLAGREARSA